MDIMDELIDAFLDYNEEHQYYLDIDNKRVIAETDSSISGEDEIDWDDLESEDRYIEVPKLSINDAFDVRENFSETVDGVNREKLLNALEQRKPFRTFKDVLLQLGLDEQWYEFENNYGKTQIEEWLEEEGISL